MSELCYLGAISSMMDTKLSEHARQNILFLICYMNRLDGFYRLCLNFCSQVSALYRGADFTCEIRMEVDFLFRRKDPETEHGFVFNPIQRFFTVIQVL